MKSSSVSPARLAAFEILQRVEAGAYASILVTTRGNDLKPADRALCHELVMGVLRWQLWLDRIIEHYSNRETTTLDLAPLITLRLGLYQLRFLSRVPASAAVNESVNLVRRARLRSAEGFVNAVLRRATREPEYDPAAGISDSVERLAIQTSHPTWLINRWASRFGFSEAEAFARMNNQPPPVAFRVVRRQQYEAEVLDLLLSAGATLRSSEIADGAWRIRGGGELLQRLAGEGRVYIQDEASQLVAQVLEARSQERVLDLCAAPGSKATQIADRAADRLTLVASDLHEHRLRTVVQASLQQGIKSIRCVALDGLRPLPFRENSFDRVLVDAPCSGTGTLRRNPEIRWRISPGDIKALSLGQKQLLANAAYVLKPGGRVIYSTCSVEPEENEQVVADFLKENSAFGLIHLPVGSDSGATSETLRTWPHRDGSDGFFIAGFERRST